MNNRVVNNKVVITSTLGFMCLALTGWMVNIFNVQWYSFNGEPPIAVGMAFALAGITLGIVGILTYLHGRTLDAVIFLGNAGLFFSLYGSLYGHLGGQLGLPGWFFILWAVFAFYLWLAAFKVGGARTWFLLALWISFLLLAIGAWANVDIITIIGGYLGLIASLIAVYISASEIIGYDHAGEANVLPGPYGDRGAGGVEMTRGVDDIRETEIPPDRP